MASERHVITLDVGRRVIISRLSPEGYLVATGKKAYSFRRLTEGSIVKTTMILMGGVWSRVRKPDDKKTDM